MSARSHLALLHELRCVVCEHMGVTQDSRTEAHHLESVRDENSHYAAVALCEWHHIGAFGVHKLSRRGFEMRYKLTPIDLLSLTIKQLDMRKS